MKEIKNDLNLVKDDLDSVKNDLSSFNKTVSDIERDLSSLNDSMNRISDNVEAHDNHMTTELMELDQNLQQNFTLQLQNSYGYITSHQCGGTGGWRRVVYLNFTDPNTPCPSGWQVTSHSNTPCGRVSTGSTCDSVTFPVSGGDYTRVCGRIIAYQDNSPDAMWAYTRGVATTIDNSYVDGVSLTHGSPRQHIWTFAAGFPRFMIAIFLMSVPVMLPSILPSHHLWVKTISVNQDVTQGYGNRSLQHSIPTILSGMEMAVLPTVHVAHLTILHISLNNSPTLPLMI